MFRLQFCALRLVGLGVKPLLLAGLPPVALDFLDEQNLLAVGVRAIVDPDVGQNVGLVPVAGLEVLRGVRLHRRHGSWRWRGASGFALVPLLGHGGVRRQSVALRPCFVLGAGRIGRSFRWQRQQHFPVVRAAWELVAGVLGRGIGLHCRHCLLCSLSRGVLATNWGVGDIRPDSPEVAAIVLCDAQFSLDIQSS